MIKAFKRVKSKILSKPTGMRKMSEIVLEMALTLFKRPKEIPSSEAAHAALLFTHVAWNYSNGIVNKFKGYEPLLKEFEVENPNLWAELKLTDPKQIIESLISFKKMNYPNDDRVIKVCGMRKSNVHVEWYYPDELKLKKDNN